MPCLDYQALIDAAMLELQAINAALLALSSNTRQSYSINTGQTQETVTAQDVTRLRAQRNNLISDIEFWCDMLDPTRQVTHTRPGF